MVNAGAAGDEAMLVGFDFGSTTSSAPRYYCCAFVLLARAGTGTSSGALAVAAAGASAARTARHWSGNCASVSGGFGFEGFLGLGGAAIRASQSLSSLPQPSPGGGAAWSLHVALSAGQPMRIWKW